VDRDASLLERRPHAPVHDTHLLWRDLDVFGELIGRIVRDCVNESCASQRPDPESSSEPLPPGAW